MFFASVLCAQVLWLKQQLCDLGVHLKEIPILCDNTSTISLAKNPVQHTRTKHIDVRHHFIRDHVQKKDVKVMFIPTHLQLADIFTKPLAKRTICVHRRELGMRTWRPNDLQPQDSQSSDPQEPQTDHTKISQRPPVVKSFPKRFKHGIDKQIPGIPITQATPITTNQDEYLKESFNRRHTTSKGQRMIHKSRKTTTSQTSSQAQSSSHDQQHSVPQVFRENPALFEIYNHSSIPKGFSSEDVTHMVRMPYDSKKTMRLRVFALRVCQSRCFKRGM
ncbi:hypothetical protein K1719_042226 [Acacia pycnantha]|nr:hypothetical protein K1719_042226 [Acacia pycnantha]